MKILEHLQSIFFYTLYLSNTFYKVEKNEKVEKNAQELFDREVETKANMDALTLK